MKLSDLGNARKARLIERKVKEEELSENPLHDIGKLHGEVANKIEQIMSKVSAKLSSSETKQIELLNKQVEQLGDKISIMVKKLPGQQDPVAYSEKISSMTNQVMEIAARSSEMQKNAKTRGPDAYRQTISELANADNIQGVNDYFLKHGDNGVAKQVLDYYLKQIGVTAPKGKKDKPKSKPAPAKKTKAKDDKKKSTKAKK